MNYWDNLDASLDELAENGFCYLPTINGLIDNESITKKVVGELGDHVYTSGTPSHTEFRNDFGITDILTPKLYQLAKDKLGYKGSIDNQYHIARYVVPGSVSEAYRGHFDSHLFTLVMPIQIPIDETTGKATGGTLEFFPKVRPLPKNEFQNVAQKLKFKAYANQEGFKKLEQISKKCEEDFSAGRPLLFMGNQTFHGNGLVPSASDKGRLSLLSHFFDPTPKWGSGAILRALRPR